MTVSAESVHCFETRSRRGAAEWLWAAAGALGLNLVLFAAMPHLLSPAQDPPALAPIAAQVNVVRLQTPERPVKRRTPEPPPPPPREARRPPSPRPPRPLAADLSLPLELNPRLPAGPATLPLPVPDPAAFDFAGLNREAFQSGDLDAPLAVVSRIPPTYPPSARHRGIEGWVRVRFRVDETGKVGEIEVLASEPRGVFDQSVISCVAGWRFRPGTVEGVAVKAFAETTIRFELD